MRWYSLVSLMVDSRVRFLFVFVVIAVTLAVVLTLIELRLKRKKERTTVKVANESSTDKMRKFLKSTKMPREKLDFIDKTAKEYFNEMHGTSLNANYSTLINGPSKRPIKDKSEPLKEDAPKKVSSSLSKNEIIFCKTMFATYYSDKKLSNERLNVLANLLINIAKHKQGEEKPSEVPSHMKKIGKIFVKIFHNTSDGRIKIKKNNTGWIKKIIGRRKEGVVDYNRKHVENREKEARELLRQKKSEFIQKKCVAIKQNKTLAKAHMARRKIALRLERAQREKIRKQTLLFQKRAHRELVEIKRRKAVLWKVARRDALTRRKITEGKRKELGKQKKIMKRIHMEKERLQKSVSKDTIAKIKKGTYNTSKMKSSIKGAGTLFKKKRKAFLVRKKVRTEKNPFKFLSKYEEAKRKKKFKKNARAKWIANIKSSIKDRGIFFKNKIKRSSKRKKLKMEKRIMDQKAKEQVGRVADIKSSESISNFFDKDKYSSLEKKGMMPEKKGPIFTKDEFSQEDKKEIEQRVHVSSPVKISKFFNRERKLVDREDKKLVENNPRRVFVSGSDVIQQREEGIAERIVRQEKTRLEKEVYNPVF